MIKRFKAELGKRVRLRSRGMVYEGILKLITESDAQIRGDFKLWSIPLDSVQSIEEINDSTAKTPALATSAWKDEN